MWGCYNCLQSDALCHSIVPGVHTRRISRSSIVVHEIRLSVGATEESPCMALIASYEGDSHRYKLHPAHVVDCGKCKYKSLPAVG